MSSVSAGESKRVLIVNADDLGLTDGVTEGIVQAWRDGVVTSASAMINMEGAAERVAAVHRAHPELPIGLHVNITAGRPVLPPERVPTLVDRDLVLYDSRVIMEYLDERFPHPPLMPVDPVTRAHFRLALYRIERDWYGLVDQIEREQDKKQAAKLKKILRDTVLQSVDLFKLKPYFLSDEFSLVDATIAPILWRLPRYEVDLPRDQAQPILRYASLVFSRPAFRESLSEAEQEMRLA